MLGNFANDRIGVNFPVARVQHARVAAPQSQRIGLSDRMRQPDIVNVERAQFKRLLRVNNMQWHSVQKARLGQLAAHQFGCKRRGVNRTFQARP